MMNLLVVIAVFIAVFLGIGGLVFIVVGILKAIKTSNDNARKLDVLGMKMEQLAETFQDKDKYLRR